MSTDAEKREAIEHAVQAARWRLAALIIMPSHSKAELYEMDMTKECIKRGEAILGRDTQSSSDSDK